MWQIVVEQDHGRAGCGDGLRGGNLVSGAEGAGHDHGGRANGAQFRHGRRARSRHNQIGGRHEIREALPDEGVDVVALADFVRKFFP